MAIIITIFGCAVSISEGVKFHYPNAVLIASNEATNKNPYRCMHDEKFPCHIGNKDNVKAIVVGDSHADALTTSIANSVKLANEGVVALTMRSCPFILNFMSTIDGDKCYRENLRRITYLESNYENVPVFWIARTSAYLYGQSNPHRIKDIRDTKPSIFFTIPYERVEDALYEELKYNLKLTIKKISNSHPVYMVQPTPEMRQNIPLTLAKNIMLGKEGYDLSIAHKLYDDRNKKIRELIDEVATMNNALVLDPIPYLCTNNRCIAQIDGRPIYYDGDHMSEFGNKLLIPMFKSVFEEY